MSPFGDVAPSAYAISPADLLVTRGRNMAEAALANSAAAARAANRGFIEASRAARAFDCARRCDRAMSRVTPPSVAWRDRRHHDCPTPALWAVRSSSSWLNVSSFPLVLPEEMASSSAFFEG